MTTALNNTPQPEEGLSILGHLNELRIRLTWAAAGLLVMTVVSFIFAEDILQYLLRPYEVRLQTLSPTEGIETFFKVSFISGAILAMPIIVYQIWLFIAPGLTQSERKYVYLFLPGTIALFMIGISFAWFILVPAAVGFLSQFMSDIFNAEWTGQEYVSFVLAMLFWIGVSFEMPIIAYFVGLFGLVEASTLASQWRFAVVGISILAAVITPSIDPVTMLLTMGPLLVLYGFSIGTTKIGYSQFERKMKVEGLEE
ncbi:MAG: twin-arginine translocase subunit TatC [Sphaerospermopsis sp. SIO1G2]|nr:twin-arginine translocase subunit TatC [Sphaerospermopsis sp. SIO1G2]